GAGRQKKEDPIDPSAGVCLMKKTGDTVEKGDVLAVFMGDSEERVASALREAEAEQAFVVGDDEPEKAPLIKGIVGAEN
ncbi:MAG: thymidine phosphorylase, partial [Clostridia bacterium]|nr:thymidine phosphorylase [Clostridia bacterium]